MGKGKKESFVDFCIYDVKMSKIKIFPPIQLPDRLPAHIPALDGLRGMAILLVLLYHCFPFFITKLGWTGVDLFFVLSGFLITGILLDTKHEKGYYKNFIIRRILRIFPLYYLVLCVLFIFIPLFGLDQVRGHQFGFYQNHQKWFWLYMQNWLYSLQGFPSNHALVHFWSLAVEEQFYIFWPFLIWLIPRRWIPATILILIAFGILFRLRLGSLIGLGYTYPYLSTLSRMDALLIGGIIAYLIRFKKSFLVQHTKSFFLLSVLGTLISLFIIRSANFLNLSPVYTIIDILFGCLLIYSLHTETHVFSLLFRSPLLGFLGKYSYGIYVYHYLLYQMIGMHFFKISPVNGIPETNLMNKLTFGIAITGLSIGISWISYHVWEKPFLSLKKYFYPSSGKKTSQRM
ncbi:peptidoglycan/LPS O-acetylase OafA/YrhL [Thermoflavifilum aggregans]|uniref:Peptidoglycan/LPS O-acetylase OafA/YrhL n=2 Tax=Thermoflavifilum aggregans TaxID=454188 RepID=A0A2M9CXG2_9BACT|nr:peptidoglycan/LPS O-acetylase OafA/YrhL [Thermoflavifilum aggregans]